MRARRRRLIASTSPAERSPSRRRARPVAAPNARMSLGRHPPPNPSPGTRKRPPILSSSASASASGTDVGPGGLADLGDRVDERDLGGQERVGGDLDQLGGGQVGHQERHPARPAARRKPRAGSPRPGPSATPTTIRSGRIVSATACPSRRNSGFQASSAAAPAGRAGPGARRRSRWCRPGRWTSRRPGRAGSAAAPARRRRPEVGQVGGGGVGPLRGADAHEVHVPELGGLRLAGGEAQPAASAGRGAAAPGGLARGTAAGPPPGH